MLFNSNIFLEFLIVFLLGYVLVRNHLRWRNILIVIASYVFYGWWDYRFLALILISTLIDYFAGLGIENTDSTPKRKLWLTISLAGNLGILGFFKYFDFFAQSLGVLFVRAGIPFETRTLGIILPVGISFYTFQTMSYTLDVYRREMRATRDFVAFMAYVSFFPQLVAGPIERARHLLPQFSETRTITRAMLREGIWLCIWGMFKKVVLADNLAPLVDMAYSSSGNSGILVILGTLAFAFQIYCDFSGYSDIARGLAKILGFDIMVNFNIPYAAKNIRDFWRRWHISLSTWLRDYLYISMGGNRRGKARTWINIMITMLLGGLWHGANWTFVVWGCWHGLGLVLNHMFNDFRAIKQTDSTRNNAVGKFLAWGGTLLFVLYGWLIFRAESIEQAASMTLTLTHFSAPPWIFSYAIRILAFTLPLIVIQIIQEKTGDLLAPLRLPSWGRAILQGALLIAIILYWEKDASPFIYFQF